MPGTAEVVGTELPMIDRVLEFAARACAIFAGLMMVAIAGMTCYSVFSRTVLGAAMVGDFELVQVGMAFAVASFMPICQLRRGNIIVDFFTQKAAPARRDAMDRGGALVVAAMMGLLAWRTALGALESHASQKVTMMMQVAEWPAFYAMVPPMALTAVIALLQAARGTRSAP